MKRTTTFILIASILVLATTYLYLLKAEQSAEIKTGASMTDKQSVKPDRDAFTLNNEERLYCVKAINEVINIISQKTTLTEHNPILGQGQFLYPKGPGPIERIFFSDLWVHEFGGSINRFNAVDNKSQWEDADLIFNTDNILANFNADIFNKDLKLNLVEIKIANKNSENEHYKFHYKPIDSSLKVDVIFNVIKKNFNEDEKIPRNFRSIEITKAR